MSRPRKHRSNLPPCVYQKHGAFHYVKGGKWSRIGSTLAEALANYAALIETPKGGMEGLIDAALADMTPRLAKNTRDQYRLAAGRLKDILKEFSPEQVRPKHIAGIKVAMAKTPAMANRCISFLRVVFQYALEQQLVETNPCLGVKRHVEEQRGRYITDDELARIYAASGERLKIIISLLYYTGQRVNDVLKLNRADCSDEGIRFKQQKTKAMVTIAWTPALRATVARAKALGPRDAISFALIPGRFGKPANYTSVSLQWREALAAAGVTDAHIHDLRAKSLTDAKGEGKNAQALAGHTSAAMTARYIRKLESPLVDGPNIRQALDA